MAVDQQPIKNPHEIGSNDDGSNHGYISLAFGFVFALELFG